MYHVANFEIQKYKITKSKKQKILKYKITTVGKRLEQFQLVFILRQSKLLVFYYACFKVIFSR